MDGEYLDLEIKAEELFEKRRELAVKIVESISGVEELMKEYNEISAKYREYINLLATVS